MCYNENGQGTVSYFIGSSAGLYRSRDGTDFRNIRLPGSVAGCYVEYLKGCHGRGPGANYCGADKELFEYVK